MLQRVQYLLVDHMIMHATITILYLYERLLYRLVLMCVMRLSGPSE